MTTTLQLVCNSVQAIFAVQRASPTPAGVLATAQHVVAMLPAVEAAKAVMEAVGPAPKGVLGGCSDLDGAASCSALGHLNATELCCLTVLVVRCGSADNAAATLLSLRDAQAAVVRHFHHTLEAARKASEVECASHCATALFPSHSSAIIDAALSSLTSVGSTASYSVATAVEVLDVAAHALRGASTVPAGKVSAECLLQAGKVSAGCLLQAGIPDAAAHRHRILDAALRCVGMQHRDNTIVPLVTRRILIPLLTSSPQQVPPPGTNEAPEAEMRSAQDAVIALVTRLAKQAQLSEATVLLAALFDLLFPSAGQPCHGAAALSSRSTPDLRASDFLWSLVTKSLVSETNSDGEAAARRATQHQQTIYLLKRLVELTARESKTKGKVPSLATVVFHALFPWHPTLSEQLWNQWFIVWEAFNEFGLHLITPMIPKIDALFDASEAMFPTLWVELLLHKGLTHSNTGVRKIVLGWLWMKEPVGAVASRFSTELLFGHVMEAAADSRLCTDIDRVVLPGSFLDCKAFAGRPEPLLPVVLPTVESLEGFYRRITEATAGNADRLRAGIVLMLHAKRGDSIPRFAVSVVLRAVHAVAAAASDDLADRRLLEELTTFARDVVQDCYPQWLEARLSALLLDTLLVAVRSNLVESDQAPFTNLLSQLSIAGETGGKCMTAIDMGGVAYGVGGGALDHRLLLTRLRTALAGQPPSHPLNGLIRTAVAQFTALVDRCLDGGEVASFSVRGAKVAATLLPLDPAFGTNSHVVQRLGQELLTMANRAAMRAENKIAVLAFFCEVSSAAAARTTDEEEKALWSLDMLRGAWEATASMAESLLASAAPATFKINDASELGGDAWFLMRTEACDILCAALATLVRCRASVVPVSAALRVFSAEHDDTFSSALALTNRCVKVMDQMTSSPRPCHPHQEFARLVVARNAGRVLYTLCCAHAAGDADLASMFNPALGGCDAEALVRVLVGLRALHLSVPDAPCPLTSLTWGAIVAQYYRGLWNTIHVLCRCCDALRLQPSPSPSPSGDASSPRAFAAWVANQAVEHLSECSTSNASAVYDVLAWAAPVLGHDAAEGVIAAMHQHLTDAQRRDAYRCCAATAVTAVRAASNAATTTKEREEEGGEEEEKGGGAMSVVHAMLHSEEDADRTVYFVALAMCAAVMQEQAAVVAADNAESALPVWRAFKHELLHVAVFVNTTYEDDESEAALAALEPVLVHWEERLRADFPPVLRLAGLSRAISVSTIAYLCSRHPSIAKDLVVQFLQWNVDHEDIVGDCRPNSRIHRSRIRLWQLTCLIAPYIAVSEWATVIPHALKTVMLIINMGSIRRYVELLIIHGFCAAPNNWQLLLNYMLQPDLRPQVLGSCATVCIHLVLRLGLRGMPPIVAAFLPELVKMCASHQHLIRLIAQVGLHSICQRMLAAAMPLTVEVERLYRFLDEAYDCRKHRERYLDVVVFDSAEAMAPHQLLCVQRKETETWLLECVPPATFARVTFAHRELVSVLAAVTPMERYRCGLLVAESGAVDAFEPLKTFHGLPQSAAHHDHYLDYHLEASQALDAAAAQALAATAVTGGGADNVQRKVTSWWHSEVHNELHPRVVGTRRKQNIVVVATFLDNPVNIAGLFRCAEIFAVERIVVADKKVFQHSHFVSAARSAELWVPWEEVSASQLPEYLGNMRNVGYTTVGIEQTATSIPMPQYSFPERCVVVVGAEGTGMPASIIPFMDVCVEIPQYGLIRSLNVHVSGAITLYEFTRQHWMAVDYPSTQH